MILPNGFSGSRQIGALRGIGCRWFDGMGLSGVQIPHFVRNDNGGCRNGNVSDRIAEKSAPKSSIRKQ
ncbi:MAG: hypothetical protein RLZZ519_3293 [Bacteroidota bacterium]|jgi:hypothetical protein